MAVRIRLTRIGRKKKPFYRLVIMESSSPRDGKAIEILGTYDPTKLEKHFVFKEDRVKYWLSVGALPSEPVERLLAKENLVERKERKSKDVGVSKKEKRERNPG